MTYLLIFILQVVFNVLKVWEIQLSVTKNQKKLLLNSVIISSVTLIASYYSLDELFSGNWVVIPIYVFGSVTGKYIALNYKEIVDFNGIYRNESNGRNIKTTRANARRIKPKI